MDAFPDHMIAYARRHGTPTRWTPEVIEIMRNGRLRIFSLVVEHGVPLDVSVDPANADEKFAYTALWLEIRRQFPTSKWMDAGTLRIDAPLVAGDEAAPTPVVNGVRMVNVTLNDVDIPPERATLDASDTVIIDSSDVPEFPPTFAVSLGGLVGGK